MNNDRRVVITGLGVVTPVGNDLETFWKNLVEGKSGIRRIQTFDTANYDCKIGGEVRDFEPKNFFNNVKDVRRTDRFVQLAMAASKMSVQDSGLDLEKVNRDRFGVIVSSGIGGLKTLEDQFSALMNKGPQRVSAFTIPMLISNMASGVISMEFGLRGPNMCIVTACATSNNSIGESWRMIKFGDADIFVAGGSEAAIVELGLAGFSAMKALSRRNGEPERASRPFDRDRDGFVISEGAGIAIVEELEHAKISPSDVDYINAHATSTGLGDISETKAIKKVFGEQAKVSISATKSMTGHLLGGASAMEMAACALAIRDGVIPPTINLENPDPLCDLDYTANKAKEKKVRVVMNNSFGFGGHNATLVATAFGG